MVVAVLAPEGGPGAAVPAAVQQQVIGEGVAEHLCAVQHGGDHVELDLLPHHPARQLAAVCEVRVALPHHLVHLVERLHAGPPEIADVRVLVRVPLARAGSVHDLVVIHAVA